MPDSSTTDRPVQRLRGTPFVHNYVPNHNRYKVDRVGMFERVFAPTEIWGPSGSVAAPTT